ncbi:MAG: ATP-binding protein [Pseudomonadota bacterium]
MFASLVEVTPDLREIGPAVDEIMRQAAAPWPPAFCEGSEELRLALTEALNNVIEHAAHPSDIPIRVTTHRATGGRVSITIEDRGTPLPETLLDEQWEAEEPNLKDDVALLPEGGWGWMLIRASVERLAFRRVDGHNLLTLERGMAPVDGAGDAIPDPLPKLAGRGR